VFTLAGTKSSAQGGNPALERELIALEKQSWEAWKSRDGDFFDRFLSDDHVEIHPGGVTGKSAVVASVRTKTCVFSTYSLDVFKLTQEGRESAKKWVRQFSPSRDL
jgi:hypothetical protein